MKKVQGVQSVNVTLNNGLVTIQLALGNHVTMADLRKLITSNGFSPREATVLVDGVIVAVDGGGVPTLKVDGTNEMFPLIVSPSAKWISDEMKRAMAEGVRVEVGGRSDPPVAGNERMSVESLKRLP